MNRIKKKSYARKKKEKERRPSLKKTRAQTYWEADESPSQPNNINVNATTLSSELSDDFLNVNAPYRVRAKTDRVNPYPTQSPRKSAPISMKQQLISTSNSVFSGMHGMNAMIDKLQNQNQNDPRKSQKTNSRSKHTYSLSHSNVLHTTAISHSHSVPKSAFDFTHTLPPSIEHNSINNSLHTSPFTLCQSPTMQLMVKKSQQTPTTTDDNNQDSDDTKLNDGKQWEEQVKQWETEGEWIEARETKSGRIMWYNSISNRIVFDSPPNGVAVLQEHKKHVNNNNDYEQACEDHNNAQKMAYYNRPLLPFANENIVEGLLQLNAHVWDFKNDLVSVYRAQASLRDHASMLPKPQQYCFPEYFSMSMLPELPGGKFLAKLRLPEEYSVHRRYSFLQIKVDHTTANDAIKQGVEKLDPPHNAQKSHFILKVVGQEAYMYGRRKLIDYEAVRDAVRNENDVEFVLIKRPDFKELIEAEVVKQNEFKKGFVNAYPINVRNNLDFYLKYDNIDIDNNVTELDAQNANIMKNGNMNGHNGLTNGNLDAFPKDYIDLQECEWHYRMKICGLTNAISLPKFDFDAHKAIYVVCELWMGDCMFENATLLTKSAIPAVEIRWGNWLSSHDLRFSHIPKESTLCLMVMAIGMNNSHTCLAWSRLPLIDHRNCLRKGKYLLNLWEIPVFKVTKHGPKTDPYLNRSFRYRGVTRDKNLKMIAAEQCQLLIEFDEFAFDVIGNMSCVTVPGKFQKCYNNKLNHQQLSKQQKQLIASAILKTPLERIEMREKRLIWRARDLLWHDPSALPSFLRSVNWTNLFDISEAHKYLSLWANPKRPTDALEYLDYRFMDRFVRCKAIEWLSDLHDSDLAKFLLQLVQCLKYEAHHKNELSEFLIGRALKNPYQIGHYFFWHLKSELHDARYSERFALYMEEYLFFAGEHSRQLFVQNVFLKRLEVISDKIKTSMEEERKKVFTYELHKLNSVMVELSIPVNPKWHSKRLIVEKCKYMLSKKIPLWLVFENSDTYASDIAIMFKAGDDLRQDMLTLQMINVMDRLWLDSKLDLHLKPYQVLATDKGVGMLQIVLHSCTVNTINMEYGGGRGAFNERTIDSYLRKYNTAGQSLKKARENFARSCAGYCVATCVLGIGDRHSDNYMVGENGQFFHIDFGHFLGNFKSKFGIKRERSPFVFTPQMKFAIDGGQKQKRCQLYEDFLYWCAEAYNVLRARSRLLLVLFALMVSAGMPELCSESDILYFKNMLNLRYEVKKATHHVHKQIASALKDKARLMDNHIHLTVHNSKSP